ncbi:MAG: MOSC N-terminal beta barrel domain-containing protein [Pseudomonadota bacterium]
MTIRVESCFVYPLKAAAALPVEQLELTPLGPLHDRRWLLVNDQHKRRGLFLSQREPGCERLALVGALPGQYGSMTFSAPAMQPLSVEPNHLSERESAVDVWGEACRALDAGDEAAAWFSDYLNLPCRLVKMDERTARPTDPEYSQPGDRVSFADSMPLLVTNRASLEVLNAHMQDEAVGMERFRPNLVFTGAAAFEEDVMHTLRIGDSVIEFALPCARCKVPTIDQRTGKTLSKEPVATLIATRRGASATLKGIFFGQNALPRTLGTIRCGDTVEVLSRRPVHAALEHVSLKYGDITVA